MFQLLELSDIYVDAVVKDNNIGQVLFISMIGTDTQLQALAASLSLPASDPRALRSLTMLDNDNKHIPLSFPQSMEKTQQRLQPDAAFSGAHVFWYSKALLPQYFELGRGYLLNHAQDASTDVFNQRLWDTTKSVCRVPLLDTWKTTLTDVFFEQGYVTTLRSWGDIQAVALDFPDEHIDLLESMIKNGALPPVQETEVASWH